MKKIICILFSIVTLSIFTSCMTVKNISPELTAAQLIQLGQSAYETGHYKNAEKYFLTALERYGDNTYIYIESQYELAHLYKKQKLYKKSYDILTELLKMYDYSYELPGAYKKLCTIELEKFPEVKLLELQAGSSTEE